MDFNIPEDASPEFKAFVSDEANAALIKTLIDTAKTPIAQKRDELLSKQSELNKRITELGGLDHLSELSQKAAEAAAAAATAQQEAIEKSGNVEQLKKHYGEQLAARDNELSTLKQSILREKTSAKIDSAIREAKGSPELLSPHVAGRVRTEMVDGKVQITVLTANGIDMLTEDGKPATLRDLINELRSSPIFQRAFEAPAVGGTGGRSSSTPSASNPWNPASPNVTEQMRLYRQDKAAAQRMAAEFNVTLR